MKIKYKNINSDDLKEIFLIDKEVYKENDTVEYDISLDWHNKNNECYILLVDEKTNKNIGYLNFIPVDDAFFNDFISGEKSDHDLRGKDIVQFEDNKSYNLIILSAVIKKKYQNKEGVLLLYEGFLKKLIELSKREIFINKLAAHVVSKHGKKAAERSFSMNYIGKSHIGDNIYYGDISFEGFKSLKNYKEISNIYQRRKKVR